MPRKPWKGKNRRAGTRGAKGPRPVDAHAEVAHWADRLCGFYESVSRDVPTPGSLEGKYLDWIRSTSPSLVRADPCSMNLGDGYFARPDFLVVDEDGAVQFHFVSSDRKKPGPEWASAARVFPFWSFVSWTPSDGPRRIEPSKSLLPPKGRTVGEPPYSDFEAEYAKILDERVRRGEICGYRFEPIAWRLAARRRYTPDFMIVGTSRVSWEEVKGPRAYADAMDRLSFFASAYPVWDVFLAKKDRDKEGDRLQWMVSKVDSQRLEVPL